MIVPLAFWLGCNGGATKPEAIASREIGPKAQSAREPAEQPAKPQGEHATKPPKERPVLKARMGEEVAKRELNQIDATISGNRIVIKQHDGSELLLGLALIDSNRQFRFVEVKEPDFIIWDGPTVDLSGRGLNYSKFVEIRDGMDELEVFKIVGEFGELVSASGQKRMVIWRDDAGGNMVLTFIGGKVTGKTQLGLK